MEQLTLYQVPTNSSKEISKSNFMKTHPFALEKRKEKTVKIITFSFSVLHYFLLLLSAIVTDVFYKLAKVVKLAKTMRHKIEKNNSRNKLPIK